MSSSSSRQQQPPPPQSSAKLYDLDITIVSAKHLHNNNWRQGNLIPVVAFWIEPGGRRFTTKPDQDGSTKPIWNERFIVPINGHITDSTLSIEITHSGNPKPIGSLLEFPLDSQSLLTDSNPNLRTFQLLRPSGRPQGKIKVRLALKERHQPPPPQQQQPPPPQQHLHSASPPLPDYQYTTHQSYYDNSAPSLPQPQQPPRDYRIYSPHLPTYSPSSPYTSSYTDLYAGSGGSGYYPGYYSQMQPLPSQPTRPSYDQGSSYGGHNVPSAPGSSYGGHNAPSAPGSSYGGHNAPSAPGSSYGGNSGPSAPVDYSSSYDQRVKGSKVGLGVGAVAGAMGGLTLEEGVKHEEEKVAERVQDDLDGRDVYGSYYRNH